MRALRCPVIFAALGFFAPAGCGSDPAQTGSSEASSSSGSTSASASSSRAASSSSTGAGAGGATTTAGAGGNGGGGAEAGGAGGASAAPDFSAPLPLSDAANNAFVPSIAARPGQCLVAWHEFAAGVAHVAYALVESGVPGPTQIVADPLNDGKQPSVAATSAGYVLAYEANDGTTDVVRAIELDATGAIVDGPVTISTPGEEATEPHVAAAAGEELFAWTTGAKHVFAMRGSGETLGPTDVGTTLLSVVVTNFPRVALSDAGDAFLAYRDGGVDSQDWDVLLVTRPHGDAFGAPVNVSNSPGLLSDDISVALEADGTLDIAWVDQDAINVDSFEVAYATRSPAGIVSAPARYGNQGLWSWTPSVVPGLAAVWYSGAGSIGPFFYATETVAPTGILDGAQGRSPVLALGPDGVRHLAFANDSTPARIEYSEALP